MKQNANFENTESTFRSSFGEVHEVKVGDPSVGGVSARIANVELLADRWQGEKSPYSQIVQIDGVTKYTQVDLTPSVEQLTIFHDKDLALVAENEDGVVTVYAIGDKPTNDYIMQVTMTEVAV